MSGDFRTFIEEVRARSDLVEIIGTDVSLKPSGSTLKALSPFHPETDPSFVVWPATQTWHDFSNGGTRGGDVFAYLQERDKVGFKEAVFHLAERAGLRRPNQDDETFQRELALLVERREVQRLLTTAAGHYHQVLPTKIREESFRGHYGFSEETIDTLKLGWADGHLFEHLREVVGASRVLALKTGLFVVLAGGHVEDFFRERLVFPYWRGGQVAYFIARATEYTGDEEWERSKYKKLLTHSERHDYVSPSVVNDCFYNEDAIRGAEELLITEGVTDCISAMQAGVPCISPVTTRFRKQDVPKLLQLTRHVTRVIVCNDSEASGAGEAGARETAAALWAEGRDVRVAIIPRPEGQDKIDVNELVAARGPEALREVVAAARSFPSYLLERIPKDTPNAELDRLLDPVLDTLTGCTRLVADATLDAVATKFGVRRRALIGRVKELTAKKKVEAATRSASAGSVPEIRVNCRQLRDLADEAGAAVVLANRVRVEGRGTNLYLKHDPPLVFRRGGRLVYLKVEEDAAPELDALLDTGMIGVLTRHADFVNVDEEGARRPTFPPKEAARHLLSFPSRGLPRIDSVITTPVFGRQGTLIVEPGFHAEERLWLQPDPGLHIPEVPPAPTPADLAHARSLFLDDLFVDFPLVDQADRAHAMAATLLPFVRRVILGNTPLHVVEAPAIGSGKGLLCHLVSIISTGRAADVSTLPGDEEEIRKTLTAELLKAQPIIVIDNAKEKKTIDSQALTSALTAPSWRSRILGKTEIIVLPNYAMWMLTGNNPRLSGELCRRCIRIRMDPKRDRAWQRADFKHDPVAVWATEHRSELVHAALVLVQAWIAAGRPLGQKRLGSFEHWAAVMGGLLGVIGVPGFMENLDKMYADADADGEAWREFTAAWWDEFQDAPHRVNELNALCDKLDLMTAVRGEGTERAQQVRLGKALMGSRDRVYDDLRITRQQGDRHRGGNYGLERLGPAQRVLDMTQPDVESPAKEDLDPWS